MATANLHATITLLFIILPLLLFSTTTVAFSISRSFSSSTTPSTFIKLQRQQHNQPLISRRLRHVVMMTDGHEDTTNNNSKATRYETTDINKNKANNIRILGICGGIGSGKSTACKLMVESLGCLALIDADKLAHSVYSPGSTAANEIIAEFGQEVVVMLQPPHSDDDDKGEAESSIVEIDRKKLGSIVFSNTDAMSKLETIVWPHVRTKIEERIQDIIQQHQRQQQQQSSDANATIPNNTTNNNIIVVEAALLLETNWHDLFDGLWIIQSTCEVSKQRLITTRGMTEKEALIRIHAQDTRRGIVHAVRNKPPSRRRLNNRIGPLCFLHVPT
jgi:dephospho-CoA kinase